MITPTFLCSITKLAKDCYFPVAPDALLLVNGLKNIVAFGTYIADPRSLTVRANDLPGFLYGVVPWVTRAGYVDTFGTQAGVFVAVIALALPLGIFGARIRHKTAQWQIIM